MSKTFIPRYKHDRITYKEFERRKAVLAQSVLTLKDVSRRWGKHVNTLRLAIDEGKLIAVKKDQPEGQRGGVIIVEYQSVIELWGEPTHE